ncbi:MAG: heavy-metal-associated domain-containing protein [Chlorobi bacterium]|nr:heavy-metal-associated domain-containing protein [Chlorobiota bacterium]
MKRFFSAALLIAIFVSFNAYAADKVNTKECKIQTSVASGHCKAKVMNGLKEEAGVVKSDVCLTSKVLTVNYDPNKTSPEKIARKVQTLGYTASVVKAACCDKTKTASAKSSCDKTKTASAKSSCDKTKTASAKSSCDKTKVNAKGCCDKTKVLK